MRNFITLKYWYQPLRLVLLLEKVVKLLANYKKRPIHVLKCQNRMIFIQVVSIFFVLFCCLFFELLFNFVCLILRNKTGTNERVCLISGPVEGIIRINEFIMEKIKEKPDPNAKMAIDFDNKQPAEREKQVSFFLFWEESFGNFNFFD